MDFTPELLAFQGVMTSTDNVQAFSRLTAKGGNEEEIKYVVNCIRTFLEEKKYINKNGLIEDSISTVRKFALYIILNAKLPVLNEMLDIDVAVTIPTIPKCLMCEMFWNLHMDKFVYEVISFTSPRLALQVAAAFIENFKYFNPIECLHKLKLVSAACHLLICRLYFKDFNGDLSGDLPIVFNNFKKCMNYYTTPPNSCKLNLLSIDEMYKYQGKRLQSILYLINECFEQLTNAEKGNWIEFDDIYHITLRYKEESKIDDENDDLFKGFNECHCCILDTCKELVEDVSVVIFCAWSEFEENSKSMQQTIGELCYKVCTKLLSISSISEHPVISMLQQIARKPIEMKDIINSTDSDTIIENINKNNGDKVSWLEALLDKDQLCHCIDLVKVIADNLEGFSKDQCSKLYNIFQNYISTDSENREFIELISTKVFQRCDITVKHKILEERFNGNTFFDMEETTEFQTNMTEIFNKLIVSPEADITDVLTVFLQSPQQVYTKIFRLAADNVHQTDIMLKLMKLIEMYSNHYYKSETEACVIKITQNIIESHLDTEIKQSNFIKFVCGLKNLDIISSSKLLLLIVMTNMHKALLNKDVSKINVQIKLLREAYKLEELLEYRAPILAMLAQVLEILRWKIHTFVPLAPATLDVTLQLQTSWLQTYHAEIPETEGRWLKSKLNLQPLNLYYYRILWNPPGNNFFEVISGNNVSAVDTDYLTTWLSQVVCSCTQQEWCDIWDCFNVCADTTVLKVFHNALSMITLAEEANRTETTWSCLLYCYRNFIFVTRYKFLKEPLTDNQVIAVMNCIATTANIFKDNIQELETLLLPLFAYLAEKNNEYTVEFSKYLIDHLSNTSLSDMINKVFVNGTA